MSLSRMLRDGPEVSLSGSPTVSPTTPALWASLPFLWYTPSTSTPSPTSNIFLALSHAPPALDWNSASNTPLTVTPASNPPSACAAVAASVAYLNPKATTTGVNTASTPGLIISLMAASVEIATQLAYSALPSAASYTRRSSSLHSSIGLSPLSCILPSAAFSSGILANCRRTSWIIDIAARPTASIAMAENRYGNIAPTNKQAITLGSERLIASILATPMYAANKASAVNAAEPMAKPLPMAAVELPTASRLSVLSRTSFGNSLISAIPPALSAIGP